MIVVRTIKECREALADLKHKKTVAGENTAVGFVPTMGYLHEGHASLLIRSRKENGISVLSIFVNPTQFGPSEDLSRYPRDEERDLKMANRQQVDVVFIPLDKEMYPSPSKTTVSVAEVTSRLCGASRPGHFTGVATVVNKLMHIVDPDHIYFGLKDAQQVAVIQQMVLDLNMRVCVVPCPTLREADGLALSSRNVFLTPEQRTQALLLSRSLQMAPQWWKECNGDAEKVRRQIIDHIETAEWAVIDYVEILRYPSLEPVVVPQHTNRWSESDSDILIALAVKFGSTRLIDNVILQQGV